MPFSDSNFTCTLFRCRSTSEIISEVDGIYAARLPLFHLNYNPYTLTWALIFQVFHCKHITPPSITDSVGFDRNLSNTPISSADIIRIDAGIAVWEYHMTWVLGIVYGKPWASVPFTSFWKDRTTRNSGECRTPYYHMKNVGRNVSGEGIQINL